MFGWWGLFGDIQVYLCVRKNPLQLPDPWDSVVQKWLVFALSCLNLWKSKNRRFTTLQYGWKWHTDFNKGPFKSQSATGKKHVITTNSAETRTTYNLYLLLLCYLQSWSLHCFPYLRENPCRNGFLGHILQDITLLQTTVGSMERHFFRGCSSLLNNVVKMHPDKFDWFWTITNRICLSRLYFVTKIMRCSSNLRLMYCTKCRICLSRFYFATKIMRCSSNLRLMYCTKFSLYVLLYMVLWICVLN
jgi:hypothetical protein